MNTRSVRLIEAKVLHHDAGEGLARRVPDQDETDLGPIEFIDVGEFGFVSQHRIGTAGLIDDSNDCSGRIFFAGELFQEGISRKGCELEFAVFEFCGALGVVGTVVDVVDPDASIGKLLAELFGPKDRIAREVIESKV